MCSRAPVRVQRGPRSTGRLPTEALSEYDFYMDTHRLRISVSNMKNANTREKLEEIRVTVLNNLSKLPAAPSAPMAPRPPSNFRVPHRPPTVARRTQTESSSVVTA